MMKGTAFLFGSTHIQWITNFLLVSLFSFCILAQQTVVGHTNKIKELRREIQTEKTKHSSVMNSLNDRIGQQVCIYACTHVHCMHVCFVFIVCIIFF